VGCRRGCVVGWVVGRAKGCEVGLVGPLEGTELGSEGLDVEGACVGSSEGSSLGERVVVKDGRGEGETEGRLDGAWVGSAEGGAGSSCRKRLALRYPLVTLTLTLTAVDRAL
jgi:hypothetical protein